MPEANVLYAVTAVVVFGLATWVAVVLKTAKEPWAREIPKEPEPRVYADAELQAANEMTSEGAPAPGGASGTSPSPSKGEADANVEADAKAKADPPDADAKA